MTTWYALFGLRLNNIAETIGVFEKQNHAVENIRRVLAVQRNDHVFALKPNGMLFR